MDLVVGSILMWLRSGVSFWVGLSVGFWIGLPAVGGVEPRVQGMPVVVEPDRDRLVGAVLHRVIDGDSVELFVDGRIVRYELAGADAPDVVEGDGAVGGVGGGGRIRGSVEARLYLLALLEGEELAVFADARRPRDAMGRLRGYVYRMPDGLFVNLEMVRLGFSKHAREPRGFNNEVMLWAQDRARAARKGVWSLVPEPVSEPMRVERVVERSSSGRERDAVDLKSPEAEPDGAGEDVVVNDDFSVVYVTKSGSKYHRKDCRHVRDSGIAKRLDEVELTHQACKVCEPGDVGGD